MFKEQVARDLAGIFHNADEFAELKTIYYNDDENEVNIILDFDMAERREKPAKDNSYGLYSQKLKAYIFGSDIKFRHGARLEIDEEIYTITGVANELGETILDLERLDE